MVNKATGYKNPDKPTCIDLILTNCSRSFQSCHKTLDQYASRKKKYASGNHPPVINKNLSKAIMLRTKLRNILLKNWTEENKVRYTKQRNLRVILSPKSKREYFNNLNERNVCDSKKTLESS